MRSVPKAVFGHYDAVLKNHEIPPARHADYKKWLRYYLDFCDKYPDANGNSEQVRLFLEKLREKKQSAAQRQEAAHAVSLYFELIERAGSGNSPDIPGEESVVREPVTPWPAQGTSAASWQRPPYHAGYWRRSQYCEAGYQEKSNSPEWDEVLAKLAAEIKVRHYSRKTLKTYALWSRQFQRFLKNKPPQELSTADTKEYLTFLAVKCHVAASTQNQAFRLDLGLKTKG